MAKNMSITRPSAMWPSNLESLTGEFGGEDGAQTVTKFCNIRAPEGTDVPSVAQRELETLERRLVPLGRIQKVSFLVEFVELIPYEGGKEADLWFTITVLPESEKPKPVEVPGAKK